MRQASIRAAESERACFNGRVESRHRTDDGSEYVHIVFNGDNGAQAKPACRNLGVIDAEFIFLSGWLLNLSIPWQSIFLGAL